MHYNKLLILGLILVLFTGTIFAGGQTDKSAADVKEEISIWMPQSEIDKLWGEVAAGFTAETGIDVKFIVSPEKHEESLQKLTILLASGEAIDIIPNNNPLVLAEKADRGALLPLDDFMKRDGIKDSQLAGTAEIGRMVAEDGKLYGFSHQAPTQWFVYYNKNLFDKAGVSYPADDWSWDDFRETAKKVTMGEGGDKTYGAYLHTWEMFYMLQAIQGEHQWYKDGKANVAGVQSLIDSAAVYKEMGADGSMPTYADATSSKMHYNAMFKAQKAAMIVIGDWVLNDYRKSVVSGDIAFKWDVAPLPTASNIPAGRTFGNPGFLSIPATSANSEGAWEFLKYLQSDAGQKIVAKWKKPINTEFTEVYLADKDGFASVPAGAVAAYGDLSMVYEKVSGGPKVSEYTKTLKEELIMYLVGSQSIEDSLVNAEKRINAILAE